MALFDFFKKKKAEETNEVGQPIMIFFKSFVLDTIGHLPKETKEQMITLGTDLSSIFGTESKDWRVITKEVLALSDTIEIAILHLWYKNKMILKQQGYDYDPLSFADDFIENYYKEGSKVDVWEGDNLEQAKEWIKQVSQE
ncbi:MAG: hypothetical protein E6767_05015 [Dysgonomonas sp.]|nr:hypothetical protein [Dysgonomonas sp.]